jgi:hypothetical protein
MFVLFHSAHAHHWFRTILFIKLAYKGWTIEGAACRSSECCPQKLGNSRPIHLGLSIVQTAIWVKTQSGFGAWYVGKSFDFRSRFEDGSTIHRESATPNRSIFTISLRDAADFVSEGVENPLWSSAPRQAFLLFRTKIRLAPRPKPD